MPEKAKTVKEFMTSEPVTLKHTDTAARAAERMREADVGALLVTRDGKLSGIVTDRDLVIRCMAGGNDPSRIPLEQLCSKELVSVSPDDGVKDVVAMMHERAIRRLPVLDGERPVGIVSIGDLAMKLDAESALASISAAPPNR